MFSITSIDGLDKFPRSEHPATIFMLVKLFDKQEYTEEFVRGELFMNSLSYFQQYKDASGELRGDEYEGIAAIYQPARLKGVRFRDIDVNPAEIAAPVLVHLNNLAESRVFCCYAANSRGFEDGVSAETLKDLREVVQVHKSCYGLGSVAAVITHFRSFRERVIAAIKRENLTGYCGLVDYFDEHSFHGQLDDRPGFYKRLAYQNQREFRVRVELPEPSDKPFRLSVGDLSDIVKISTPEEFNRELKLGLPDGSQA